MPHPEAERRGRRGCSGTYSSSWEHEALANDDMRGRDTGTPEHRRAQEYVARHLERHGVRPAGEEGFFQAVPLRSFRLRTDRSSAALVRDGQARPLRWLRDLTVAPARSHPNRLQGRLVFAGSDNAGGLDLAGAIVVRLNPVRMVDGPAVPPPPAGAAVVVGIDSAIGPEPTRWPAQYAVTMTLADSPTPEAAGPPAFRFNPASAEVLFEGSGQTYTELLDLAASGQPVPSFPLQGTLTLTLEFEDRTLTSDNVIGVLPGSDPALAPQHVVLTAHIDGYGVGETLGRRRDLQRRPRRRGLRGDAARVCAGTARVRHAAAALAALRRRHGRGEGVAGIPLLHESPHPCRVRSWWPTSTSTTSGRSSHCTR